MDPQSPRSAPPPLPDPHVVPTMPPMRAAPLQYAAPVPAGAGGVTTIYHQAAKASWVAPLLVIVLGCIFTASMSTNGGDAVGRKVQGGVSLLLIVGGTVCGIVALCGLRRHGKQGILAPAIVGLVLNGLWVLLLVGMVMTQLRVRGVGGRAATVAPAPPPAPLPVTSPQSALRQTGWMGVAVTDAGCTVGAMAMAEPHVDTANLKNNFAAPCKVMVLWFDNRAGRGPITVDTDGATLRLADGSVVTALRARDVLSTAKVDRAQFIAKFAPPYNVPAGKNVEGLFLFVPPEADLSKATYLYLTIDGARFAVPGRVYTAQEKTDGMNRGNGAAAN
jgi:hypothetical protein